MRATPDAGADVSQPSQDAGNDTAPTRRRRRKILPNGLLDLSVQVARTARSSGRLRDLRPFEDWGTASSIRQASPRAATLGSAFGTSLIDSIDGDDGVVDGKCEKSGGNCNSGFANGTIDFTFDAATLGALPTHVGIAWTDGSSGCDAVFEAYDATDTLIGTKTATGVGDGSNTGTVDEDRYFAVVHSAGVKKIVVKSSAGGVEVDHLHYGR
jgi:hypothetical protein